MVTVVFAGLALFGLLAGPVFAQAVPFRVPLTSGHASSSVAERALVANLAAPPFDYPLFLRELLAYVLKEALPEAGDEYAPARRAALRPPNAAAPPRSHFGKHCLTVLGEVGGRVLPSREREIGALHRGSVGIGYGSLAGAALVGAARLWSPFRNHIEGGGPGISLDPKVGSRKVGLHLTLRW